MADKDRPAQPIFGKPERYSDDEREFATMSNLLGDFSQPLANVEGGILSRVASEKLADVIYGKTGRDIISTTPTRRNPVTGRPYNAISGRTPGVLGLAGEVGGSASQDLLEWRRQQALQDMEKPY